LPTLELLALTAIFFLTSVISVVTGSTSLMTVPALLQIGIDPRVAVATTNVINIVSSLVATIVFALLGLIDYQFGILLGVTMFLGATLGGYAAFRMKNV
jgi:uncharacterized protein